MNFAQITEQFGCRYKKHQFKVIKSNHEVCRVIVG